VFVAYPGYFDADPDPSLEPGGIIIKNVTIKVYNIELQENFF
jgi:hypothetical protein